jgi:hypothetical protein
LGLFLKLCSDVEGGRRAGGLSRNWRHGVGSAALFGPGRRPSRSSDSLIARSAWPARVRQRRARPHDREKYRISNGRRNEIRRLTQPNNVNVAAPASLSRLGSGSVRPFAPALIDTHCPKRRRRPSSFPYAARRCRRSVSARKFDRHGRTGTKTSTP